VLLEDLMGKISCYSVTNSSVVKVVVNSCFSLFRRHIVLMS